jgi:hypothetical protein
LTNKKNPKIAKAVRLSSYLIFIIQPVLKKNKVKISLKTLEKIVIF